MSGEWAIDRGLPDREATLDLLNEAYGDWGNAERLQWRYNDSPGYSDEHTFYITVNDELAAFRRLFAKEIIADSRQNYDFYVLGDTCVSLDHRGEGLYSTLHTKTTEYCQQDGKDFSATFNRVGNVTYEANRDRGWRYRTLPVRLHIISPEVVIPQYAQLALADDGVATIILERIGHRFGLSVAEEQFRLQDLVMDASEKPARALYVPVPELVVPTLVEVVTSEKPVNAVQRRLTPSKATPAPDSGRATIWNPPVDDAVIDAVHSLYDSVTDDYVLHFRRAREDVQHMLEHPSLEALITVERHDELVAAAPLCLQTDGDVLEAQILDVAALDDRAFATLREQIETVAHNRNADAIVMITDHDVEQPWIRVDRQVMMWDDYGRDTTPLTNDSLHIGLYDVT